MRSRDISAKPVRDPGPPLSLTLLALLACVLGFAAPAHAHRSSLTRSTITISHDQTTVSYRLELEPADTAELVGLAPDTSPTDEQVQAARPRMFTYVLPHIEVRDGEVACAPEPGAVEVTSASSRMVVMTWQARCPAPMRRLVLVYSLFEEIDRDYRAMVLVRYRGQQAVAELGAASGDRFTWDLDAPPPSGFAGFLVSGVEHILFGFDHIAFLLALLLTLVVWRADGVHWERRQLRYALRDTAFLVTTFTLAHSATLIAASLGWISAPGRVVESLIAMSIVFVAIENIVLPESGYRLLVAFGFGLVHGLGFASMLAALLPPDGVLVPLLAFNVGVELGQLAVVVVVLPLLHGLVRLLDAPRYRTWLLPAGSAILGLLGALWLVERAFDVVILGF